jgi:flagellin
MKINHNIASLNTYRQLTNNTNATSKSLEKLSSGLRINSAADDAAGLAISEKMRGQIRGLDQASSNSEDGISLVQTAEGALNETTSILQRMRELAVQSSSDTNTDEDRDNIQDEMDQLTAEIDRISTTTQYNTKNLLDGSMGKASVSIANVNTSAVLKEGTDVADTGSLLTDLTDSDGNSLGIAAGDTIDVSYEMNGVVTTDTYTVTSASTVANMTGATADAHLTIAATTAGAITVTAADEGLANAINGLTVTVKDSTGTTKTDATNALNTFEETTAAANVQSDGTAILQIGANSNQTMQVSILDMGASALGVAELDITTATASQVAINAIDTATQKVSAQRSALGAIQNRLEHTINNLGTSSENLTSAESNIRDVDMAKEMTEYTKNNILTQAATSMLAQANQQPQSVLSLLQ